MSNSKKILVVVLFILIIIVGITAVAQQLFLHNSGEANYKINSSQAEKIVLSDEQAANYYRSHFYVKDLRVNNTTIVHGPVPNMKNVSTAPDEGIWRVYIMERNCACAGIKFLYVIEGYVSTNSGKCLNISTKLVNETSYDSSTCASTSCH